MNNKLLNFVGSFFLCLLAFAVPVAKAQATPSLLFTPTSAIVTQNNTITLTINVNVDANAAQTSDVSIKYASNDLDFVPPANNGGFFPSFSFANDPANGVLELHGNTSSSDSRTGTGSYATVVFKAKKNSGSGTISFDCANTHIYSTALQNILSSCTTQTNSVALTYGGESAPTNTPTPTVTPTPTTGAGTPTPTAGPTPTPQPNTVPTCVTLSSDTSLAVGTPLSVAFTCSGVDPDGYINAAEFTFGDGTTNTIYKNAGSPGSISTTHSYTTIGTLGASCRVRDNNNVFSTNTNDCRRIIVIKPKPVNAVVASYYQRVIAPQTGSTTPTLNPTPEEVAFVYTTPAPATPSVSPIPASETKVKSSFANLLWWIVGGIVAIIGAVMLLRKKNPPPFQSPPPIAS